MVNAVQDVPDQGCPCDKETRRLPHEFNASRQFTSDVKSMLQKKKPKLGATATFMPVVFTGTLLLSNNKTKAECDRETATNAPIATSFGAGGLQGRRK